MAVYIVANTKGGSGKSKTSGHIIPEYIRRKGKQERVMLYEFDEHSRSSENYLQKSNYVNFKVISKKDIETEIFDVRYDAQSEDVIVDVGAGDILHELIKVAELGIGLENLVFVVPYSNDASLALKETIDLIESKISNPKIMIVLNRIVFDGKTLEEAKSEAIELYGSKALSIEPNPVLKDVSKYIKTAIPDISKLITVAALGQESFTDIKARYDSVKDLSSEKLKKVWKDRGLIAGESMTKEENKRNYGIHLRESKIADFLDDCEEFYVELARVEKNK